MDKLSDLELIGELWRRRVEYLWSICEMTSGDPLDIGRLDSMIEDWERSLEQAKRK